LADLIADQNSALAHVQADIEKADTLIDSKK
jgi:hypothetical protein